MGYRVLGLATVLVLCLPIRASGESKSAPAPVPSKEKLEAKQHFDKGTIHFNLDEWPQAIEEFRAAYHVFPDPSFLYNIAQCHRKMGNLSEAVSFYKNFLRARPDAPNRGEVERRIDELQATLAEKTKAQDMSPSGQAISESAPAAANQGAAATAKSPSGLGSAAPPAESSASSVPAGADLTSSVVPAPGTSVFRRWWFWTAIGGAVAAVVVFAVVKASSKSPSPYQGNLEPTVLGVP